MEVTTDLAMWTSLVSFLLPVLVAVIQQPRWQPRTRALVAALSSLVAGVGTVYLTDPDALDAGLTTTVVLTMLVASTAVYRAWWKPVGIRVLESATSPGDDTLEEGIALLGGGLTDAEAKGLVPGPRVHQ